MDQARPVHTVRDGSMLHHSQTLFRITQHVWLPVQPAFPALTAHMASGCSCIQDSAAGHLESRAVLQLCLCGVENRRCASLCCNKAGCQAMVPR